MESKNERTLLEQSRPAEQAPKKRFRIVKLEERIAPGCKLTPQSKEVSHCGGSASSSPPPANSIF